MTPENDRKTGCAALSFYAGVLAWGGIYNIQLGHVFGGLFMLLAAALTAFGAFYAYMRGKKIP